MDKGTLSAHKALLRALSSMKNAKLALEELNVLIKHIKILVGDFFVPIFMSFLDDTFPLFY